MITAERLKELIEQGTTIYEAKYGNINSVPLTQKIKFVGKDHITFEPNRAEKYSYRKYFNRLFDTKEDAEWQLEFGNITRTETLKLPTWEEMKTKLDKRSIVEKYYYYTKHFTSPKDFGVEKTYSIYLLLNGNIVIDNNEKVKTLFNQPLTKENYIEACRMAKKLFLGEEV